jgi:hypothetical protein
MMMSSLRERFATLDRVPMPELWSDARSRAAQPRSAEPVTSVTVRIPPQTAGGRRSSFALLAAAAALVALLAGVMAVGSGLVRLSAILPAPGVSPSPVASPSSARPSPSSSAAPSDVASDGRPPWIVFLLHVARGDAIGRPTPLWAMRADGSGAHEIHPGSNYTAVAWSHDGSRLLLNAGHILVAEVGEDIGPFVDTGVGPAEASQWEAFDFAPDNGRVVHVDRSKCPKGAPGSAGSGVVLAMFVAETAGANCWALDVLDLRTGARTALTRTLVKDQTGNQNQALELPAWSPDGTRIAYTVLDQRLNTRELWVVNADGTAPSRIELAGDVSVREPRWSPDGTRISFTSVTERSAETSDSAVHVVDVATGRLERVTIESVPGDRQLCCAEWLDSARLRVADGTPNRFFWSVTVDPVAHEAHLLVDLTQSLAAAGMPGTVTTRSAPGDPGRTFHWQPRPAGRP